MRARGARLQRVVRTAGALLALAGIFVAAGVAAPAAPAMSRDEVASLKYASQQTKLARDVYRALERRWSMGMFATLARSDSRQMTAVKALLSRYRVRDPVAGMPEGRFADATFERLYRTYVRQGQWSRWDARSAAMRMERAQIRESRARLLRAANPDLRRLLTQLQRVATNHVHTLEHWGEGGDWSGNRGDDSGHQGP